MLAGTLRHTCRRVDALEADVKKVKKHVVKLERHVEV